MEIYIVKVQKYAQQWHKLVRELEPGTVAVKSFFFNKGNNSKGK